MMNDIFTNINTITNTIVTLVGIAISIYGYKKYIKEYLFKKKIIVEDILLLENEGLIIENQELLHKEEELKHKPYIYFPVVPTCTPNIIHLIFSNYLIKLISSGLKVNLFVFDSYYIKLNENKSPEILESNINTFISLLKGYIKNNNLNVIRESTFIEERGDIILKELFNISHELTLGDIKNIQKEKYYIDDNVSFIRYIKPISNMLYLKQTSEHYGFTLSGMDEKKLWELFENTRDSSQYKLCNLYIPKVEGLDNQNTSVLDSNFNICFGEKYSDIFVKVKKYFSNKKNFKNDTSIALFIKICIFQNNNKLEYTKLDGSIVSISSWDLLINNFSNMEDLEKDSILEFLTQYIYSEINLKKE